MSKPDEREELARQSILVAFQTLVAVDAIEVLLAGTLPQETPALRALLAQKLERHFKEEVVPDMVAMLVGDSSWTLADLAALAAFVASNVGKRWLGLGPKLQALLGQEIQQAEVVLYRQARAELDAAGEA